MCHTDPPLWVPGGDIKVTHSIGDPALNTWYGRWKYSPIKIWLACLTKFLCVPLDTV